MSSQTNYYCWLCKAEYEKWCLLTLEEYDKTSKVIPARIISKYSSIVKVKEDNICKKICEFCYQEFLNIDNLLKAWGRVNDEYYECHSCRICCTDYEEWNLVPLQTVIRQLYPLDLFQKLGMIIGDDILKHDSRPNHICEFCFSTLKIFSNFNKMLVKSENDFYANNSEFGKKECEETYNYKNIPLGILNDEQFDISKGDFLCKLCTPVKKYLTSEALELHHKNTHQIFCHGCQFCGRVFISEHQRTDHENTHTNNRPHICDYEDCNKTFHKKSELINHKKIHDKAFQMCNICGKKNLINLKKHLKLHTQSRYKCPACPRAFLSLASLEVHSKMHKKPMDNERQYKCEYCQSIFKRGDRLKEHINSLHLNIKPHICTKCGKKFTTGYQLNTHVKQIHNESAFSCDKCGRTYSLLQSLIKHKRMVHENFKPFKCEICREGFTTFRKLKIHQDNHNLDENERKKIVSTIYRKIHKNIYES